ncbi:hypothetical protein BLNAU_15839 [Blattamonas nauphoetae]|uniref:Uncharacterized protein n=1 Tax=Blattamonas nauphoetae TaxID=2049346 RepID=A0ABQ9X9L1_9EUKA|nr:hypothetical protein BLNAU_15839 [Blattamonas nauphoetae]
MIESLNHLRDECEEFLSNGWHFFVNLTYNIAEPHKSSFETIVLDDPSFPDLILNSLRLNSQGIRENTIISLTNIVVLFERMTAKFMTVNLVSRMFGTVDFISLPLSESKTLFELTNFISCIFYPIGDDDEEKLEQYPHIRVCMFEPAKQFITFIFNNSDRLFLDEQGLVEHETQLCLIHFLIKNMELRADEHDADVVSELVKWEERTMVEMENEENFMIVFENMLDKTQEWNQNQRERQKRREVLLREEGWDDAFELRVVGIELDTNDEMKECTRRFRVELTFNADEL